MTCIFLKLNSLLDIKTCSLWTIQSFSATPSPFADEYTQAPFEELILLPDLDEDSYIILSFLSVLTLGKIAKKRNFVFRINCFCYFRIYSHSPSSPGKSGGTFHLFFQTPLPTPHPALRLSACLFGNSQIWNIHRPSITMYMAWLIDYFRETEKHCPVLLYNSE